MANPMNALLLCPWLWLLVAEGDETNILRAWMAAALPMEEEVGSCGVGASEVKYCLWERIASCVCGNILC